MKSTIPGACLPACLPACGPDGRPAGLLEILKIKPAPGIVLFINFQLKLSKVKLSILMSRAQKHV